MIFRSNFKFGWLLGVVFLLLNQGVILSANLPLTDMIFFGKVHQKGTHAPITGNAPPVKVEMKINTAIGPADTVVASAAALLTLPGQSVAEYYVLRIRRFESGTPRQTGDAFVMPGDRIRILLGGVEVAETEAPVVLATDAPQDIRFLDLNGSTVADSDNDGLPDFWEEEYFGALSQDGGGDSNRDGVSNFLSYALGLDPRANNTSKLPFLSLQSNGGLVFYFRQAMKETGLKYRVLSSEQMAGEAWSPVAGVTPEPVGIEGNSRLLRVTIPKGVDRTRRFFRLEVAP